MLLSSFKTTLLDRKKNMDTKTMFTGLAILTVWVLFMVFGNEQLVTMVCYLVAGFQIGGWSYKLANWALSEK